jgi:hypothetical protein
MQEFSVFKNVTVNLMTVVCVLGGHWIKMQKMENIKKISQIGELVVNKVQYCVLLYRNNDVSEENAPLIFMIEYYICMNSARRVNLQT